MNVTICGGGNASHALAALLSSRPDMDVRVYSPFQDEAQRWQKNLASEVGQAGRGFMTAKTRDGLIYGQPRLVSADPKQVVPGTQLILLALPAFAHQDVMRSFLPFIDRQVVIGALPARGGFDWECKDVFQGYLDSVSFFGMQTLPWACRIERFGAAVSILGTKREADIAVWPSHQGDYLAGKLSDLFKLQVKPISNFLSLTLANPGQIIHPGIMYGLFHQWDGTPYTEAPLFYQNVDGKTARLLSQLSDEIQGVRFTLQDRFPELDLSAVVPLDEWLQRSYRDDVSDASSVQSCFQTNRVYASLRAPMRPVSGGLAPDFQARYLVEDVPYGLLVTRGIAELAGIETPVIDQVVDWSQDRMSRQYLIDNKLCGRDVAETRAPQRYGIKNIKQMIGGMI